MSLYALMLSKVPGGCIHKIDGSKSWAGWWNKWHYNDDVMLNVWWVSVVCNRRAACSDDDIKNFLVDVCFRELSHLFYVSTSHFCEDYLQCMVLHSRWLFHSRNEKIFATRHYVACRSTFYLLTEQIRMPPIFLLGMSINMSLYIYVITDNINRTQ